MKRMRFFVDYHCSPVWTVEEDGGSDNGLPDDLKHETELAALLDEITQEYDSLFVDEPKAYFEYRGFPSEAAKRLFFDKVYRAAAILVSKAKDRYEISIEVNEAHY